MLLTLGDMDFLSKATEKGNDGLLVAKTGLSEEEKERLSDIDEMNFTTYGEHLIKNHRDLK
jgi:hypothetical protein